VSIDKLLFASGTALSQSPFPKPFSRNCPTDMKFRERQDGPIGLRRKVQLTVPPCPPLPQSASLADPIAVPFEYAFRRPPNRWYFITVLNA